MKKVFFILTAFVLLNSCSKNDQPAPIIPVSTCAKVATVNVSQQSDVLQFTMTATTATALFYEISYQFTNSGNIDPNFGSIFSTTTLSVSKEINTLNISTDNTYIFYARAVCEDGSKSGWSTPISLQVTSYCNKPTDLGFSSFGNFWGFTWTGNTDTSYYQVQYGPQNFSLGAGTTIQTNSTYYTGMGMAANTTYDFYVRSYCSSALGWSSWSGPYTYLSVGNQNLCSMPTNLSYIIESTNSQTAWVSLHWAYNGETNFEYTVVPHNQAVTIGTIGAAGTSGWPTINRNRYTSYDYYIRSVCSNGNKTAWAGPLLITL